MQNLRPEVPPPFWALMGLCRGLPGKELLRILKLDTVLCNRLLEGFEMNGPSLSLPLVRQRVARALQEDNTLFEQVLVRWKSVRADACTEIHKRSIESIEGGIEDRRIVPHL